MTLILNFLRVWVWILTVLYVIQAITYFIGAISLSANIDEVKAENVISSQNSVITFCRSYGIPDMLSSVLLQLLITQHQSINSMLKNVLRAGYTVVYHHIKNSY